MSIKYCPIKSWPSRRLDHECLLLGKPLWVWIRFGTIIQFVGGFLVIVDLIGSYKLRQWGNILHRYIDPVQVRKHLLESTKWIFYLPYFVVFYIFSFLFLYARIIGWPLLLVLLILDRLLIILKVKSFLMERNEKILTIVCRWFTPDVLKLSYYLIIGQVRQFRRVLIGANYDHPSFVGYINFDDSFGNIVAKSYRFTFIIVFLVALVLFLYSLQISAFYIEIKTLWDVVTEIIVADILIGILLGILLLLSPVCLFLTLCLIMSVLFTFIGLFVVFLVGLIADCVIEMVAYVLERPRLESYSQWLGFILFVFGTLIEFLGV